MVDAEGWWWWSFGKEVWGTHTYTLEDLAATHFREGIHPTLAGTPAPLPPQRLSLASTHDTLAATLTLHFSMLETKCGPRSQREALEVGPWR